jgi:hypothetical protein
MKTLTDLLKEAGIEMGKVYTDKDRPPFKGKLTEKAISQDRWDKALEGTWIVYDIPTGKSLNVVKNKEMAIKMMKKELDKSPPRSLNIGIKPLGEGKLTEASDKIRVQGLGVYDHKSLSKKVGKMVDDLSKRNRKGNHTGLGKRQLGTLAAMWEALSDYEEKK